MKKVEHITKEWMILIQPLVKFSSACLQNHFKSLQGWWESEYGDMLTQAILIEICCEIITIKETETNMFLLLIQTVISEGKEDKGQLAKLNLYWLHINAINNNHPEFFSFFNFYQLIIKVVVCTIVFFGYISLVQLMLCKKGAPQTLARF